MSTPYSNFPPCIVFGVDLQIGLYIIRELGQAGIRVIGIASNPNDIGLRSRWLTEGHVIQQPHSEALLELLRTLGNIHGRCPLIATSEAHLLWLAQCPTSELGLIHPVLPSATALQAVINKEQTLELATKVGIKIPYTWQPISLADIDDRVEKFPTPAVLKWKNPHIARSMLEKFQLSTLKSEHVATTSDLRNVLLRYLDLGQWPMVQEYCPGYGLGQFFFIKNHHTVRRFQHMRLAEWPPEGGYSTVCTGLSLNKHADLQERSIALLNLIDWEGVAMVEYRYDPLTNRSWLMEINGRFWGSFPLASQSGASFALLTYLDAIGEKLPKLPPVKSNLRARMVFTELKRLWRICIQPDRITDPAFERKPLAEIARFFSDFFRRNVRYYVWSWRDPLPFLQDLFNMFWNRLK
ncbi:carboxylate--amine ligase [Candidatus Nitrosacidococcus tergens]|uniref:ATP-grasp domain-containing protein n=1 Tax=Candidatus Nitrosacidococcus tergens TaxID=553981 RepID=A0A7G1Q8G0_9GAMM|nr:hypothetical protein [Candidatus Nitrosacidococcus tergens]CAB1275012.1 conserved protein of unknown function [Candidatus Nitrosacidococcus tergens]